MMHYTRDWKAKWRMKNNKPLTRNYLPNINLTPSNDLAYLLGVYFGDGSADRRHGFRLGVITKRFAESVAESLKRIGFWNAKVRKYRKKSKGSPLWGIKASEIDYYEVNVIAHPFLDWIQSMRGVEKTPNDTVRKFLTTKEMKSEFIRGIYESEGCTHQRLLKFIFTIRIKNCFYCAKICSKDRLRPNINIHAI